MWVWDSNTLLNHTLEIKSSIATRLLLCRLFSSFFINKDTINQYFWSNRSVLPCLSNTMGWIFLPYILEFVEWVRLGANVFRGCFKCDWASTLSRSIFCLLFSFSVCHAHFLTSQSEPISLHLSRTRTHSLPSLQSWLSLCPYVAIRGQ